MSTRYFNGTTKGSQYHATVTRREHRSAALGDHYDIEVIIFSSATGEPIDGFSRTVPSQPRPGLALGQRAAVQAVIANRDNY